MERSGPKLGWSGERVLEKEVERIAVLWSGNGAVSGGHKNQV